MRQGFKSGVPLPKLAIRTLLLSPTYAFEQHHQTGFEITERVAEFFSVSVRAVHACGSAKLGFSPVKRTPFLPTESDLDLAIIDHDCFTRYLEIVIRETEQYRDLRGFQQGNYLSFSKYIAKGIFRPDFMPASEARKKWFAFFGKLSQEYSGLFLKISAGIYLSDSSFELKQSEALKSFLEDERGL